MTEYPDIQKQQKDLLLEYGSKLKGIDKSFIKDVYFPTLDTTWSLCKEYLEPNLRRWDHEGAKLVDGKTEFPKGVDEAYKMFVSDKNGLRLYEALLPEEYDGVGFPALMLGPISESMAFFDTSFAITVGLGATIIEAISLNPTEYLTHKYFPIMQEGAPGFVGFTEPVAGSNLRNIKTTSELDGDYYKVKGTKIWISNAGYGKVGIVLARNIVNGKDEGTNAFVVETDFKNPDDSSQPGIKCIRLEEKLGIHASSTGVLEINCLVPKENLLGKVGKGYRTVLERLMGMRMGVAFQASALAERAYQLANEYAGQRVQFNKPIISFAGVANKIHGIERELLRMRRYAFEAAFVLSMNQRQQAIRPKSLTLDTEGENMLQQYSGIYNTALLNYTISKAKMYNTEVGWLLVDDALQIFGGNGISREYNVERILRDFRVLRIYEGTSEIQEFILNSAKGVAHAKDLDTLMKIAMSQGSENTAAPESNPLNYQNIFFTRFGSVKDVYTNSDNSDTFLFDN